MGFSVWHWIIALGLIAAHVVVIAAIVIGIRANRRGRTPPPLPRGEAGAAPPERGGS